MLKSSLDNPTSLRDDDGEEAVAEAMRPQVSPQAAIQATAQVSPQVTAQAMAQASVAASAQYAAHYAAASELDPASGEDLSDWTATLDIINGMAGYADEQRSRVKEQAKSYKDTLQDLQKELRDVHQRLRLFEKQAAETQLQADARVQRIQAEADAQVQDIRLAAEAQIRSIRNEADGRVKIAEEKTRAANLRALTAEKWLQRIDNAAKNLLTGVHTGV